ncbi:MAG: NUDIX domain-containing protein [Patescibacteria group bacterium]
METILEIKDGKYPDNPSEINIREAARAILFNDSRFIPLLFVSKHGFHKLPGGGLEEGEEITDALAREIEEETGCQAEITGELGKIIEFRSRWKLKQTSYCYLGKITSQGKPNFTEKETLEGFKLVWLELDQAISQMEKERPDNYEGNFIQKRDLAFLKKARETLKID